MASSALHSTSYSSAAQLQTKASGSTEITDQKFSHAIQLLKECFAEKSKDLFEEILKLRQLSTGQNAQISSLEMELTDSKRRIKELEAQLSDQRKENLKLVERYNKLVHHTNDLHKFKMSIVSAVETEGHVPAAPKLFDSLPTNASNGNQTSTSTPSSSVVTSNSKTSTKIIGNTSDLLTNDNTSLYTPSTSGAPSNPSFGLKADFSVASSHSPNNPVMRFQVVDGKEGSEATKLSPTKGKKPNEPQNSGFSTSNVKPTNEQDHEQVPSSLVDNAHVLYGEIKEVLNQQQFIEFAGYINKLNSGELSVEETLASVGKMLNPKHQRFFLRLQQLIQQAASAEDQEPEF